MFALDIPTQLLDLTLIRLGQALAFFCLWKIRPDYLPARDWAVGAGLSTLGLLAPIALPPGESTLLASISLFNIFALSGWFVFNAGVVRAAGYSVPWSSGTMFISLGAIGIVILASQAPAAVGWRLALFHTCTIALDLYAARCCLRPVGGTPNKSLKFVAVALGMIALSSLARVILSFDPKVTSGFDPLLFNLQFLLISTPILVITALLLTVHASEAAEQELQNQARRDALTQALNRRGFDELASREWARARRSGSSVGLLTLDVDNFKYVNDTHGHHFGDRMLEMIAARTQSMLRPEDLFGRMGGDEFLVMLPNSTLEQTSLVAERIRIAITELRATHDAAAVSVSVGVTAVHVSTQDPKSSWDAAFKTADRALYAAKNEGRNRVVSSAG